MNKILILILTSIFLGCKGTKTNIQISQMSNSYPIILKYNKKYDKFSRMEIPLKLKIHNGSFQQYSFASIRYKYNSKLGGITETVYEEVEYGLKKIKNNKRKYINSHNYKEYIIYTSHRLDSSIHFQNQLKPYIKIAKDKNIDTLNIGTIEVFKIKNKKLLNFLTKNDSLFINTWDAKNIILPVKW